MNKLTRTILPFAIATGLSTISLNVQALDLSIGAKGGTLGYGMDLGLELNGKLGVRTGFNQFDFNYDGEINNSTSSGSITAQNSAQYTTTFDFNTVQLLADYHPFHSGFRLSAGAMLNNNKLTGTAVAGDQTITIGNYTSTQGADLRADVEITFPKVAPYLGIGYDASARNKSGLSLTYDLGVMFQGEPTASVELSGADANQVSQADIDAEVANVNDTLSSFNIYPVMNLGLAYTF